MILSVGSLIADIRRDMASPKWRGIWIIALILFITTNIATFRLLPFADPQNPAPGDAFALLGTVLVKLLGLNAIIVAALRIARESPRAPWAMDGSWWLSLLVMLVAMAFGPIIAFAIAPLGLPAWATIAVAVALSFLPLLAIARWRAAIAVEHSMPPLGVNLAAARRYFVPALILSLVVMLPLAAVHGLATDMASAIDDPAGDMKIAIADGIIATILTLFELALLAAIHRQTDIEPETAAV